MNRHEIKNQVVSYPDNEFQFSAKWITLPELDREPNQYFRAYKSFLIEEVPEKALLRICADSYYLLFVNGQRVHFGPVRGTWTVNYFDTLDVTGFLCKGENRLEVMVHSQMSETFIAVPVETAFILELPGVVKSDASWQVSRAGEWKRDVEFYTKQTDYIEYRDFRLTVCDWHPAREVAADSELLKKRLAPRNVPPMREWIYQPVEIGHWREVEPAKLEEGMKVSTLVDRDILLPLSAGRVNEFVISPDTVGSRGVSVIVDFGCDLIGRLEAELEAPAGTIIDVIYNEEIWQQKGDRLQAELSEGWYNVADRYILAEGENIIGTQLSERGFKMVQLTIRDFREPVRIKAVRAIGNEYPYQHRGAFHCNDELLNRIMEVCVRTLEVCTTDVFLDCPWRERAFWVNDLIVENATTLAAFGAGDVHRRAFELAFSQQRDDGFLPGVCPAPHGTPRQSVVLVPTNLFIITMLQDYLLASGDFDTVRKYLPQVRRILELFETFADEKGVLTAPADIWNFYDWSFGLNNYSFNGCRESMLNYLYVTGLKTYGELCDTCGEAYDREGCQAKITRTMEAVKEFVQPENGYLLDNVLLNEQPTKLSSQLAHAFALLAGETNEHFKSAIVDPDILCPELYLHFFVFRAMKQLGGNALADGLERIRKYWGKCVNTGYPTLYEAGIHKFGREAFREAGSLCHGFGTAPIEFFQRNILGVTPLEPGYRVFEFQPNLFDLEYASGRIPTPSGEISVHCEGATATLEIPPGLTARFNGRDYEAGTHSFELK